MIQRRKFSNPSNGSIANIVDTHTAPPSTGSPTPPHHPTPPPTKAHYDTPDHLKWRRRSLITAGAHAGRWGSFAPRHGLIVLEKKREKKEKKWEGREGYETLRRPPIPRLPRIPRHWSRRSHKSLLTPTVNGYKKAPGFLYVTWSLLPEEGGGAETEEEWMRAERGGGLENSRKCSIPRKLHICWRVQLIFPKIVKTFFFNQVQKLHSV